MRARLLLLAWLAACGLQEIELARAPLPGEVLVLDGVTPDRIARFASAREAKPDPKLALAHPPAGAAIPANVAPLPFAWGGAKMPAPEPPAPAPKPAPAKATVYELHLRSAGAELRVYLTASQLTIPDAHWRRLLDGADGAALEVQLRALDDKGALKTAPPVALDVRAPLAAGALYYVVEGEGVARAEIARAGHELIASEATCAGCRPVARDGSARLVSDAPELVVETLTSGARSSLPSIAPTPSLEWASFSPDGARLVASAQGAVALSGPQPSALLFESFAYATEPDWSPEGARLALAVATRPAPMMPMDMQPAPNAIAQVALDADGAPGAEVLLLASAAPDEALRTPSFSPDGRFLAFARQKRKGEQSALGWLEAAAGGAQGELSGPKARDALPSWLPSRDARDYWLVFSSNREGPHGKPAPEQLQLWSVALTREADGSLRQIGEPFWLPCQAADTSNQRALFAATPEPR